MPTGWRRARLPTARLAPACVRHAATLAALAAWLWAKYTKMTAATAAIATHLPIGWRSFP